MPSIVEKANQVSKGPTDRDCPPDGEQAKCGERGKQVGDRDTGSEGSDRQHDRHPSTPKPPVKPIEQEQIANPAVTGDRKSTRLNSSH